MYYDFPRELAYWKLNKYFKLLYRNLGLLTLIYICKLLHVMKKYMFTFSQSPLQNKASFILKKDIKMLDINNGNRSRATFHMCHGNCFSKIWKGWIIWITFSYYIHSLGMQPATRIVSKINKGRTTMRVICFKTEVLKTPGNNGKYSYNSMCYKLCIWPLLHKKTVL